MSRSSNLPITTEITANDEFEIRRNGVPMTFRGNLVEGVFDSNIVLLNVSSANLGSNTIEVTGPAWVATTDGFVFYLPSGGVAPADNGDFTSDVSNFASVDIDAAIARREFGGGVYLDGTGSIELSTPIVFLPGMTVSYWASDNLGSRFAQAGTIAGTTGGLGFVSGASTDNRLGLIAPGGSQAPAPLPQNFEFTRSDFNHFVWVWNDDDMVDAYVNGSLVSSTINVTNAAFDAGITITGFGKAGTTSTSGQIGRMSDQVIFNAALTASQAESLYELGTEGFLGENPSLAAGALTPTYESDFSAGTEGVWLAGNGTIAGNVDAIGGIDDTLEFTSTVEFVGINSQFRGFILAVGEFYRVDFDGYIPSSNSAITEFAEVQFGGQYEVDITGITVPDTWQTYSAVGSGSSTTLNIRFTTGTALPGDGTGDVAYIKNVKITKIGAIAHLPLTDDCRQLRDRSPNRYDALASATGITHLKRAEQHTFRTDTGTTTDSPYLVAAADILEANEVVTGVVVDGRYVAASGAQTDSYRRIRLFASGSDLLVQRSNGTLHETIVTATPASLTAFSITALTSRY